jgi:TonB-dependent starch-binding outer membrane protein SusC
MRKKRLLAKTGVLSLLLLLCIHAFPQNKLISGKVTDSKDGSPLRGVSVVPLGSHEGTTTDNQGVFHIQVSPEIKRLVFTFIGFSSREISIEGDQVNVSLEANNSSLNEIVVIGYGTQKKKDLTGSITTVSAKDFQQGAISTPEQLITGKVAGVVVTPSSGQPGVGSTIRIRGGTSISASNDPLIILDGVPLESITPKADGTSNISGAPSPLSMINPDDIESFTVLKDASATAIYGNRASNGVIIITTKKGKRGPLRLNLNSLNSIAAKTADVDVLSAAQLRKIVTAQGTAAQAALLGNANTNWQDLIYQKAFTTDNSVSVSGGIKHLPYRVSLGYLDNNGILKTGFLKRTSAALNLSPTLLDNHLHVDVNLKGTYADNRFASSGAIGEAVRMDPTQPVYDKTSPYGGYFEWKQGNIPNVLATRNPLADMMLTRDVSTVKRSIGNVQLDYSMPFLPELRANMNIGYDISRSDGGKYIDPKFAGSYTNGGSQSSYSQYRRTKLFDFYFNYTKDLSKLSSRIDVTAGYEYEDFYRAAPATMTSSVTGTSPVSGDKVPVTYSLPDSSQNTLLSYYGRLNYTFHDRYLLTATVRRDGSSRFGPDNRYGTFPSVALAWRISQESFMKSAANTVSDLKLRLGYGVTGNQDIGNNYGYLPNYTLSTAVAQYQFGNTFYNTYRGEAYAANLKWEHTATYDAGIDYGFFKQRLYGSLDFYYKKTSDLLLDVTQPSLSNLSNHVITNVGSVENRGVELNINALAVTTRDFNWNAGFNISYYKNKITKLNSIIDTTSPGIQTGSISGGTGNQIQINSVGYATNSFYLYKQVYNSNGIPVEGVYGDINKNGGSNLFYRYKSPNPAVAIGFSSQFSYRSWNLSFAMHGDFGNYMYNNVKANLGNFSSISNPNNYIGNASTDYLHTNFQNAQFFSNYYVENASFVRMDNITLGYNFGKVIQKRINLRLSAIIQNAFVITKYSGLDPEVPLGIDNNIYPKPRIYSLGINLDY